MSAVVIELPKDRPAPEPRLRFVESAEVISFPFYKRALMMNYDEQVRMGKLYEPKTKKTKKTTKKRRR